MPLSAMQPCAWACCKHGVPTTTRSPSTSLLSCSWDCSYLCFLNHDPCLRSASEYTIEEAKQKAEQDALVAAAEAKKMGG